MRVSIIISVFNCLELTRKCLESLDATIPEGLDHEIILVDDGSSDGSRDFLHGYAKTHPRCNVILNDQNFGYARSNNRAFDICNGTHALFLNNDTELTPGWMEPMVEGYTKLRKFNPGIIGNVQRRFSDELIDHCGVYVNAEGKPDHLHMDPAIEFPRKQYSERLAATGACILMPCEVFREVGKFDTAFQNGGEDMDLNFKVRRAGYTVFVANKSCIWHHVSASPGRNNHHERNTRIVFTRWRELLLNEGSRQWALDYANNPENRRRYWSDSCYRKCRQFRKGWRKQPPEEAVNAVDAKMREQEEIWVEMFDKA
jgi:GT2 family glycosyltransferase